MKNLFFTSCLLVIFLAASATNSTLTIFSEDGHRFILMLNGVKMNYKPEKNIRLQGLNRSYYKCRIVFEDSTLDDIKKNYLPITEADNQNESRDVTYSIRKGKKGKPELQLDSAKTIQISATRAIPADVVVYDFGYGYPSGPPITGSLPTTLLPDTTRAAKPLRTDTPITVHTPVTTTASIPSTSARPNTQTGDAPIPPKPCTNIMSQSDFHSAKATIEKIITEETKISTAKAIAVSNCLYATQISEICRLFTYERSRIDFAKFAYSYCFDRSNYFKVNDAFDSDKSREELNALITR